MENNIKLDYSIDNLQDRKALVEEIVTQNENLAPRYLEILADYLVFCMEKNERKEKKILTDNRCLTIDKREKSYEGLAAQFESGEDAIYNLMNDNNKNEIFHPKISITQQDIEEIPFMKQLRDAIGLYERLLKKAKGKDAYTIKRALIEMHREQYILKNAYKKTIMPKISPRMLPVVQLDDYQWVNRKSKIIGYGGVTLLDPNVCKAILNNYSKLKEESYQSFDKDLYYLMLDFDNISSKALQNEPIYKLIVEMRIDGHSNVEIAHVINGTYECVNYSAEYVSSLWNRKIPKVIADAAEDAWVDWYFLVKEKGTYKYCKRCGKVKLAIGKYFSKNKSSKDGFYSICKECRNKRNREKKKNGQK